MHASLVTSDSEEKLDIHEEPAVVLLCSTKTESHFEEIGYSEISASTLLKEVLRNAYSEYKDAGSYLQQSVTSRKE